MCSGISHAPKAEMVSASADFVGAVVVLVLMTHEKGRHTIAPTAATVRISAPHLRSNIERPVSFWVFVVACILVDRQP